MDLRRMKNVEKLAVCRRYYIAGFFVLPFIWLVNSVWFFREAFRKPPYAEQAQIKTYVIRSMAGTAVWVAILVTWGTLYQLKRVAWGELGEHLTLIQPYGSA